MPIYKDIPNELNSYLLLACAIKDDEVGLFNEMDRVKTVLNIDYSWVNSYKPIYSFSPKCLEKINSISTNEILPLEKQISYGLLQHSSSIRRHIIPSFFLDTAANNHWHIHASKNKLDWITFPPFNHNDSNSLEWLLSSSFIFNSTQTCLNSNPHESFTAWIKELPGQYHHDDCGVFFPPQTMNFFLKEKWIDCDILKQYIFFAKKFDGQNEAFLTARNDYVSQYEHMLLIHSIKSKEPTNIHQKSL